jgi:hypothetical protein
VSTIPVPAAAPPWYPSLVSTTTTPVPIAETLLRANASPAATPTAVYGRCARQT